MHLRWTRPAQTHLAAIHAYIARDNPAAAGRVLAQIRKDANLLKLQPGMGRPGRIDGTREQIVSHHPYIIVYRLMEPEDIQVVAVIHTARLWPEGMPGVTE